MKKILYLVTLFVCVLSISSVTLAEGKHSEIPNEIREEAREFLNLLVTNSPKIVYAKLDSELKKSIDFSKVEALVSDVNKNIGNIDSITLINSRHQILGEQSIYSLLYIIETKGNRLKYTIDLVDKENGVFIRSFNFNSISSSKSTNGISTLHIVVVLLFILSICIQLWCAIYFSRRKNLKRKWLYILSSFLGFPIAIGFNWVAGTFAITFGFTIPAVSFSIPSGSETIQSLTVFFPFGLIFLLRDLKKRKNETELDKN